MYIPLINPTSFVCLVRCKPWQHIREGGWTHCSNEVPPKGNGQYKFLDRWELSNVDMERGGVEGKLPTTQARKIKMQDAKNITEN